MMDTKVSPNESFKWVKLLREIKFKESGNKSQNPNILINLQEFDGHEGGNTLMDQFHDSSIEIVFLEFYVNRI